MLFSVNENPTDTTVRRYLFTAKLLYVFRVSQHPSSGVLKTVPAASGTGHTTCTATPLQLGLIGTQSRSDHVDLYRRLQVQFLILLMMGAVTPETCRVVLQWINICILLHLLDFYSHVNWAPCKVDLLWPVWTIIKFVWQHALCTS